MVNRTFNHCTDSIKKYHKAPGLILVEGFSCGLCLEGIGMRGIILRRNFLSVKGKPHFIKVYVYVRCPAVAVEKPIKRGTLRLESQKQGKLITFMWLYSGEDLTYRGILHMPLRNLIFGRALFRERGFYTEFDGKFG